MSAPVRQAPKLVVRLPGLLRPRQRRRFGRDIRDAVAEAVHGHVHRRHGKLTLPAWAGVLWAMALLSMLLLPSNYRAGSDAPHGHSLMQLWLDTADGRVEHHHTGSAEHARPTQIDWLDPSVSTLQEETSVPGATGQPDVGEHEDSTPAPGGVHLLLAAVMILPAMSASRVQAVRSTRRLRGRNPLVLFPPPRWTAAA